jgi:flavin reductase (DIM6/NTAB) family NADH-FMN oxidoreductase RutF
MAEPATALRPRGGRSPGWDALRAGPGPDTARCLGMYAKLAAGVCVVTAPGEEGPLGMTVSAVTSLSATPPLLLVCLRNGSRTLEAIHAYGAFAVHLLREEQHGRAAVFADPGATAAQRFEGTDLQQVLGVPVFGDALGWSVCLVEDVRRYGDHHLVVGRMTAVHVGAGRPLLWHDRRFGALAASREGGG